jgi:RHS repeat-associated protein
MEDGGDDCQMRLSKFFNGTDTFSYGYDANGNLISVSNRFTGLSYDNLNRLRQIQRNGGQIDRYYYDSRGLRFKRIEDSEGVTPHRTYTIYAGELPVIQERYEGTTKTETRFNLIVSMGGAPQIAAQFRNVYGGGQTLRFFYSDHLGSRRVVLDSEGDVQDKFEYSPWGEATHPIGTEEDLASFTGKEYDATGLIYFNARYYDPSIGRFITEDPSRKGTGWYTYCGNNPLNRVDPTGRQDGTGEQYAGQQYAEQEQAQTEQSQTNFESASNTIGAISSGLESGGTQLINNAANSAAEANQLNAARATVEAQAIYTSSKIPFAIADDLSKQATTKFQESTMVSIAGENAKVVGKALGVLGAVVSAIDVGVTCKEKGIVAAVKTAVKDVAVFATGAAATAVLSPVISPLGGALAGAAAAAAVAESFRLAGW